VLIHGYGKRVDILAWPVPDIDVEVHDPPTLLAATLSPRVALSVTNKDWFSSIETFDAVMAALPLDSLVTLTAQHFNYLDPTRPLDERFWLRHAPKWPLLRRVRLAPPTEREFTGMLLEDNGGRESPLLPSLTELVLVDLPLRLREPWALRLCDALMKRVELGVPLEMLDLRGCAPPRPDDDSDLDGSAAEAVQPFSEIVVDVLGPDFRARVQMDSMWYTVVRGHRDLELEFDFFGTEDGSDSDD